MHSNGENNEIDGIYLAPNAETGDKAEKENQAVAGDGVEAGNRADARDEAEAANKGETGDSRRAEADNQADSGGGVEAGDQPETDAQPVSSQAERCQAENSQAESSQPEARDSVEEVNVTELANTHAGSNGEIALASTMSCSNTTRRDHGGNEISTKQSKFSIAFLSQSTSENYSQPTTSATTMQNSSFSIPFEPHDIFSTPIHILHSSPASSIYNQAEITPIRGQARYTPNLHTNSAFTATNSPIPYTTHLEHNNTFSTPTHTSNPTLNTPFLQPYICPGNCNVTIESMNRKIEQIESKMEGMEKEMNKMKSVIANFNGGQSGVHYTQNANESPVLAASRPLTQNQPDFTNRGILECKGASFIKGTTFTHFEMNSILDDIPSTLPRIVIDMAMAASVNEVHYCKCGEDLAKWLVLEVFSLQELYRSSCGNVRGAVVKAPLDNVKIQSIKSIVLKLYGKGENEKLNTELWQRCKDKINRSIRYLSTKIKSHAWIKVGLA